MTPKRTYPVDPDVNPTPPLAPKELVPVASAKGQRVAPSLGRIPAPKRPVNLQTVEWHNLDVNLVVFPSVAVVRYIQQELDRAVPSISRQQSCNSVRSMHVDNAIHCLATQRRRPDRPLLIAVCERRFRDRNTQSVDQDIGRVQGLSHLRCGGKLPPPSELITTAFLMLWACRS